MAKERGGNGDSDGNKDEESEPFLDTSDTDSKGHPITSSSKRERISPIAESSSLYKGQLMVASLLACCLNMAFMEAVLRIAPQASNFVAFVQHLFITAVGLLRFGPLPFGLWGLGQRPKIPARNYLVLALLNLAAVLTNNASLNYGVSIPLNMIFKSSSLIANMFLGMLILRHSYSWGKKASVLFITAGLFLCTWEDYKLKVAESGGTTTSGHNGTDLSATLTNTTPDHHSSQSPNSSSFDHLLSSLSLESIWQLVGIGYLAASLFISAGIGIYQERLRNLFGKHPSETLFYVHLISLAFFPLIASADLGHHWALFSESARSWTKMEFLSLNSNDSTTTSTPPPVLVLYLLLTVLTQYCCILLVYTLTTECASLTVTLVVTTRKFASILFSILYFGHPFTPNHWLGTGIVFGCILLFTWEDVRARKGTTTTRSKVEKKESQK